MTNKHTVIKEISTKQVLRDELGRPHSYTEPAFLCEDGWGVYCIHGIPLGCTDPTEMNNDPKSRECDYTWLVTKTKKLTIDDINNCANAEVRRVMLELYGIGNFIQDSKAEILDTDKIKLMLDDGTTVEHERKLVRYKFKPDFNGVEEEDLVGILVFNSSPNGRYKTQKESLKPLKEFSEFEQKRIRKKYENTEYLIEQNKEFYVKTIKEEGEFTPDLDILGNFQFKTYFIPCDPELRPKDKDEKTGQILWVGKPQELTVHNALASTFGLYGDEYAPEVET